MSASNKEKSASLTSLKARALKAYAIKDYPQSAELYSEACELQTEINGENNPANAHLLYLYGRSLFKVAIDKSDVLGAKGDEKEKAEEAEEEAPGKKGKEAAPTGGLFQFQGDENFDDSDDEEVESDQDGEGEEEEEEDDMAAAWQVLDLARVFFERQLAAPSKSTTDESAPLPLSEQQIKDTKTMLADVYDLLGEVSLESENFPQATKDFDSSLTLKNELYPSESTLISEAEFKMALALEFSSSSDGISKDDEKKLREAAAGHIEKAIASCRGRIAVEEAKIAEAAAKAGDSGKGKGKAVESKESKEIENVQEMIGELEQRLHDLRNPPVDEQVEEKDAVIKGLLGQILQGGKEPLLSKEALQEAMKGANDLSSLVRKKTKTEAPAQIASSGKRKLEDVTEEEEASKEKKAKVVGTKDSSA